MVVSRERSRSRSHSRPRGREQERPQHKLFEGATAQDALAHLDTHGFVIVPSGLNKNELEAIHNTFINASAASWSNRSPDGTLRWRCSDPMFYGGDWRFLYNNVAINAILAAVVVHSGYDMCVGSVGADVCYPGAVAQSLHSDFRWYDLCSMRHGFSLGVSIATRNIGIDDGPMRMVPWSDRSGHSYPDMPLETPGMAQFLCMKAGDMLIRDVRCPHAGSFHNGTDRRVLPTAQIFSTACCSGDCSMHARFVGQH
jgi:hypothetical protein